MSSSLTILMTCWAGFSAWETSAPRARSLTCAMNVRTTGSATSASSSAMRISRAVASMSASDSRPLPRSVLEDRRQAGRRASRTRRLDRPRRARWDRLSSVSVRRSGHPTRLAGAQSATGRACRRRSAGQRSARARISVRTASTVARAAPSGAAVLRPDDVEDVDGLGAQRARRGRRGPEAARAERRADPRTAGRGGRGRGPR